MHNITFISTIHDEIGECNAEELYKIIKKLDPEVIFLEADDKTYSEAEQWSFSTYGVYHKKLEVAVIQKYSTTNIFEYVTVCENSLADIFRIKNKIVGQDSERQQLSENFRILAAKHGFKFLNSLESMDLLEKIQVLESRLLNRDLDQRVKAAIEAYEIPMIRNIYSYANNHHFNSAIFMCGAAHRKSIIEKIEKSKTREQVNLTWTIFEG